MKIFYLEDHKFFASEVIEYLEEEGHEVFYSASYDEAEYIVKCHSPFDCSLLDVILQNGKTGILFAEEYADELGRIMFITGTPDKSTLDAMERYSSASKLFLIWDKIESFLNGDEPKIDRIATGNASGSYKINNGI